MIVVTAVWEIKLVTGEWLTKVLTHLFFSVNSHTSDKTFSLKHEIRECKEKWFHTPSLRTLIQKEHKLPQPEFEPCLLISIMSFCNQC